MRDAINGQRIITCHGISPRLDHFDTANLLFQRRHMLLQLSHALFQRALVLFQQQPTIGRGGVSLAAQLGEASHLRAWHACVAQA